MVSCGQHPKSPTAQVCAQDALQDPDPTTRALLLGFNSVDEYAQWIRNVPWSSGPGGFHRDTQNG